MKASNQFNTRHTDPKKICSPTYLFALHKTVIIFHQSGFTPGDSTVNQLVSIH